MNQFSSISHLITSSRILLILLFKFFDAWNYQESESLFAKRVYCIHL